MNLDLHSSTHHPENKLQMLKFWILIFLSVCFLISCGDDSEGPDRTKIEEGKIAFAEENYDKAKRQS